MTMNVEQAEKVLADYKTRENAAAAEDAASWDEAYNIAFGAYLAERNFEVDRGPGHARSS